MKNYTATIVKIWNPLTTHSKHDLYKRFTTNLRTTPVILFELQATTLDTDPI